MNKIHSIVFFGTHELAVPALETLVENEATPKLIVTHPSADYDLDDDSAGHPVIDWAQEHGVDLVQSPYAVEPDLRERIVGLEPDLMVVVDYGESLPTQLLEAVEASAIEVHPSMLPHIRGPHALRGTISSGVKVAGVSVFEVNEDPWCGPVHLQEEMEVGKRDTFEDVLPQATEISKNLLTKILKKFDRAKKPPKGKPQKETKTMVAAPEVNSRHRKAPWSLKAQNVYDRLRAYHSSGLKAYFQYRPVEILSGLPMEWVEAPYGSSGTFLGMRSGKLAVICGESTIFGISRIRWPGGEVHTASEFAFAERLDVGDRFA